MPLRDWLAGTGWRPEDCGLAAVPHAREVYALFSPEAAVGACFSGFGSGADANDGSLSPIPEGATSALLISFNKDGYSTHCRAYREYWEWLEKRNDARYCGTLEYGKNYDAKNMMHTFRLLRMAAEIAREGRVLVRRPDREFLLRARSGEFSYDDLLKMADERLAEMEELYATSPLPERPDEALAEVMLVSLREEWYNTARIPLT